jgi:hypothetical protein
MDLTRIYRTLLQLYPKDYQFQFEAEMREAFQMAVHEQHDRPALLFTRFVLAEFAGLIRGASAEWCAKFMTDASVRARYLPDLRMMPFPWVPSQSRAALLRKLRCSSDTSQ